MKCETVYVKLYNFYSIRTFAQEQSHISRRVLCLWGRHIFPVKRPETQSAHPCQLSKSVGPLPCRKTSVQVRFLAFHSGWFGAELCLKKNTFGHFQLHCNLWSSFKRWNVGYFAGFLVFHHILLIHAKKLPLGVWGAFNKWICLYLLKTMVTCDSPNIEFLVSLLYATFSEAASFVPLHNRAAYCACFSKFT